MKKFLFAFLLFGLVVMPVFAQEETTEVEEVEIVEVDGEVSVDEVPMPGTFANWWLQNITEKFETFAARTDEQRVELEGKFADRREAQLERLESLPDDHPQKEALIEKLEDRYDRHVANIEERAERLTDKKAEILDNLAEKKDRFDAKKEWVQEKKDERGEKKEALQEKIQERREERVQVMEERKEQVMERVQDKREDAAGRIEERRENPSINSGQGVQDSMEQRKVDIKDRVEFESSQRKIQSVESRKAPAQKLRDRVDGVAPTYEDAPTAGTQLNVQETNQVLGAMDYAPVGFFERVGWWLQGL